MSVDGDDKEDYIGGGGILRGSKFTDGYFIISGNPVGQPFIARGFIPRISCGANNIVKAIGDVTGDGIGDLAEGGRDGCFTIYKGINWQSTSVTEQMHTTFTLHSSEPNPIVREKKAVVPITIEQPGVYSLTLYDLSGRKLGDVFSGELPSGEVRLPFDAKALNIPAGMYELRLSDGKHSREHAIVVGW
jgi:hypothetical protein